VCGGVDSIRLLLAFPFWDRPADGFRSRREYDRPKLRGQSLLAGTAKRVLARLYDTDLFARLCWRFAHLLAFLLLVCISGCAPTHPGETFFAGYISPDKQAKMSYAFVVKNTTSYPVEILTVDKNCSCTSFELGKYRLARGESTTLTIDVDVLRSLMTRTGACFLRTDHPRFKDWSYSLTFVSTPLAVADPNVLNLGSFNLDGQNLDTVKEVTLDLFAESKIELARDSFTVPDEIELNVLSKAAVRKLQPDMWKTTYKV
jgi:hypothetical protein